MVSQMPSGHGKKGHPLLSLEFKGIFYPNKGKRAPLGQQRCLSSRTERPPRRLHRAGPLERRAEGGVLAEGQVPQQVEPARRQQLHRPGAVRGLATSRRVEGCEIRISRHLRSQGKPVETRGNHCLVLVWGFLRWCMISSIHSRSSCVLCQSWVGHRSSCVRNTRACSKIRRQL